MYEKLPLTLIDAFLNLPIVQVNQLVSMSAIQWRYQCETNTASLLYAPFCILTVNNKRLHLMHRIHRTT